jgi:uncharacterized protein YuzE
MHATYDNEADALSITLLPTVARARTVQVARGVLAHFDRADHLIEFEILEASAHYPHPVLEQISSPAEYLTLSEAAREAGLAPSTLRWQIRKQRLVAEKRGHDWLVTRAALWTYLENRSPRGRPPRSRKARRARKRVHQPT